MKPIIDKFLNRMKTWINQLSLNAKIVIGIHVVILLFIVFIDALDYPAKIALFAFLSAMTLWITTKIPAGFVAVALIAIIILMNAAEPELLYQSFSEEVVWLMIGAFIIGEAVKTSGLTERLTLSILKQTNKKSNVVFSLSSVLFATVFFIPSTSGRAALSIPVMSQLSQKFTSKEKHVLAVLVPVVILMSTSATLIGAGSHLIGIGLLESTVGQSISYIQWFIWGLPFAFIITLLAILTIKWILWPRDSLPVMEVEKKDAVFPKKFTGKEKKTLILVFFLIAGWMTENIHGYPIAFITILGALVIMTPNVGTISWKQGIQSVSWNLILFVASATALGKALLETGVIEWMQEEMLGFLYIFIGAPEWIIVLIILLVTVTSHLYITSHTTRAIVFIPGLLVFSETIGVHPSTVVFLSLIGFNYCVTFPVSSKALLLYYEEEEISYDAKNLLKISIILMPLYILLMMLFYFTYWQWTGLHL